MLSRVSLKAVQDLKPALSLAARSSSSVAVGEERDLVTFPRSERRIEPGKVRFGFVPDEWFTLFYSKTGVTGPYVFGAGLITFLYSKEILCMEHEFYVGCSEALMAIYAINKFGPSVAAYMDKEIEAEDKMIDSERDNSMAALTDIIGKEKESQFEAEGQKILFEAKKENIGLQLEAAYRERLVKTHELVKKRLDYQLETDNVKNRLEQRHIVRWVVDSVKKALTPTQEAAAMKQCLSDLKLLAKA